MKYTLYIAAGARQDMREIFRYIADRDGKDQAQAILERLDRAISTLESLPNRGNAPPELDRIGFRTCRELHEPPYRIIYQVEGHEVRVLFILDARRNIKDILGRRLLR